MRVRPVEDSVLTVRPTRPYWLATALLLVAALAVAASPVLLALWQHSGDRDLDCLLRSWPHGVVSEESFVDAEYGIAPSRLVCTWQRPSETAPEVESYLLSPPADRIAVVLLVTAGATAGVAGGLRLARR
ncbi:hypothetical protein [Cellulosimicrobium cellulans]|uniref:hypothetical protein n=1 Tax=Cellulosimicrobium cellulans TaxID=1710 RepID=UPI0008484152|nr:hypothetical protein [Cellulosimicrobium cellulans]